MFVLKNRRDAQGFGNKPNLFQYSLSILGCVSQFVNVSLMSNSSCHMTIKPFSQVSGNTTMGFKTLFEQIKTTCAWNTLSDIALIDIGHRLRGKSPFILM